jgi:hypothetical protein
VAVGPVLICCAVTSCRDSRLAVYEVAGADLGSIMTPLLASVRKENESGFHVL